MVGLWAGFGIVISFTGGGKFNKSKSNGCGLYGSNGGVDQLPNSNVNDSGV